MNFYAVLQKEKVKLNTVYDLACLCYEHLNAVIDNQARFLGEYILEDKKAGGSNINLRSLHRFSEAVGQILEMQEKQGVLFKECLIRLEKKIKQKTDNMKEFGDSRWNDAAIPYFLLQAIDRYVIRKKGKCTESSPLNKSYHDKFHIYLDVGQNMLDKAAEQLDFPDIPESLMIRKQLRNLIVLENDKLPKNVWPPLLCHLYVDDEDGVRKEIKQGTEWRVALIPFAKETSVTFPAVCGASFRVQYEQEKLKEEQERAICLLDKAIDAGANIVVFPEYVCCPKIQEAIRKHLRKLYHSGSRRADRLFLVIAGSGWYAGDNNIACLYSYSGRKLGKQYKYAAYHDINEEPYGMVERLTEPGKEVTIVSIDGIGKCMTAVCRDISNITYDDKYIPVLAEIFAPMFLLIPAWSSSVNIGFKEQLKGITQNNHRTCSLLCNCCNAFGKWDEDERKFKRESGEYREELAIAVTPYKDGSTIVGKDEILQRKEERCNEHCDRGGCIYLVDMSFEHKAVEDGRIIQSIVQKFV